MVVKRKKGPTGEVIGTGGIPNTAKTYESFVGDTNARDLSSFMDEDDLLSLDEDDPMTWDNLWGGMPRYVPTNTEPKKQLIISFDSMDDFFAFGKLTGIHLTPKTKSAYWPDRQITVLDVFRWVDDGKADEEAASVSQGED